MFNYIKKLFKIHIHEYKPLDNGYILVNKKIKGKYYTRQCSCGKTLMDKFSAYD